MKLLALSYNRYRSFKIKLYDYIFAQFVYFTKKNKTKNPSCKMIGKRKLQYSEDGKEDTPENLAVVCDVLASQ